MSAFCSCRSRIVHSQLGYSSSGSATGSWAFFKKFSPFNGWPAGIELLTSGVAFFSAALAACALRAGDAVGVRGSLNGWAADVDVAVGGVCEDVEEPCRGAVWVAVVAEMGAAFWRAGEVVRKRCGWRVDDGGTRAREAARRQLRHIILGGIAGRLRLDVDVDAPSKS